MADPDEQIRLVTFRAIRQLEDRTGSGLPHPFEGDMRGSGTNDGPWYAWQSVKIYNDPSPAIRREAALGLQRDFNEYAGEPLTAALPGVALQEIWELTATAERALNQTRVFVLWAVLRLPCFMTVLMNFVSSALL